MTHPSDGWSDWGPLSTVNPTQRDENLERLHIYHPRLLETLKREGARGDIAYRSGPQGEKQCCIQDGSGGAQWIVGGESFADELRGLGENAEAVLNQGPDLLVCFGVGLGYLPVRVARAIWETGRCLVVVERDPGMLWGMLNLHDLKDIASMPNILWLVGDEAIAGMERAIREQGLCAQTRCGAFRGAPVRTADEQSADEKTFQRLGGILQELSTDHARRVNELAAHYTLERKSDLRRILILDMWENAPGGLHLRCFHEALEEAGFEIHHKTIPRWGWVLEVPGHPERASRYLLEWVDELRPDLIFTVNSYYLRFLSNELTDRLPIPSLSYTTAPNEVEPRLGPREYFVTLERAMAEKKRADGWTRVFDLPLAAGILREPPPDPEWSFGDIPLSFFGTSFMPDPDGLERYRTLFTPYVGLHDELQDIARELAKPEIPFSFYEVERRFLREKELPPDVLDKALRFVFSLSTGNRRVTAVRVLLKYGIQLFGGGWETVLAPHELERCYRGYLPPDQETNVYRHSSINLNVHSTVHEWGVNMRFFNVPAAGAFQITDDRRDYARYFEPGEEMLFYRTTDELEACVERYLHDPEGRQALAVAGRRRVLKEHTYAHRLRELIPIMERAVQGDA